MVLDLFSGLEGWSAPFRAAGHEIYRVEIDPRFPAEHRDVMTYDPRRFRRKPDVVLASPPCTGFSVMQIGTNWTKDHQPKTDSAELGLKLLRRALWVIRQSRPVFWVLENPRAKMRMMPELAGCARATVTYCKYGEVRMKPTDLWGGFPPSFMPRKACKQGDKCHVPSPRGSQTGTQGMESAEAARIPWLLADQLRSACERDFQKIRGGK